MAEIEKMTVSCDGLFRAEAYVDIDDDWNGWLKPYFTFDEARRILDECAGMEFSDIDSWHYDASMDSFCYHDGELNSEDSVMGALVDTTDGTLMLYPIGSCAWTWSVDES